MRWRSRDERCSVTRPAPQVDVSLQLFYIRFLGTQLPLAPGTNGRLVPRVEHHADLSDFLARERYRGIGTVGHSGLNTKLPIRTCRHNGAHEIDVLSFDATRNTVQPIGVLRRRGIRGVVRRAPCFRTGSSQGGASGTMPMPGPTHHSPNSPHSIGPAAPANRRDTGSTSDSSERGGF